MTPPLYTASSSFFPLDGGFLSPNVEPNVTETALFLLLLLNWTSCRDFAHDFAQLAHTAEVLFIYLFILVLNFYLGFYPEAVNLGYLLTFFYVLMFLSLSHVLTGGALGYFYHVFCFVVVSCYICTVTVYKWTTSFYLTAEQIYLRVLIK